MFRISAPHLTRGRWTCACHAQNVSSQPRRVFLFFWECRSSLHIVHVTIHCFRRSPLTVGIRCDYVTVHCVWNSVLVFTSRAKTNTRTTVWQMRNTASSHLLWNWRCHIKRNFGSLGSVNVPESSWIRTLEEHRTSSKAAVLSCSWQCSHVIRDHGSVRPRVSRTTT